MCPSYAISEARYVLSKQFSLPTGYAAMSAVPPLRLGFSRPREQPGNGQAQEISAGG
ncbi:MAG TPA: hypothetical protein VF826_07100 [Chloroflexia bacterium]